MARRAARARKALRLRPWRPAITAALRGDLRGVIEAEVRDAARAMRRAVANAWRLSLYPPPAAAPRTLRPAALVWTNAPRLADASDRGIPIVARGGVLLAGAGWLGRPDLGGFLAVLHPGLLVIAVAGQLRFEAATLASDVNGDSVAGFQIAFTGAVSLIAASIWLFCCRAWSGG